MTGKWQTCSHVHIRAQLYQHLDWQRLTHAQQMSRNEHILLFCSTVTSLEQNSSKFIFPVKTEATKANPGLALMLMFILLIKGSLFSHTFGKGEWTTAAVAGVCQQLCINWWSYCWFNLCYSSSPQQEMTTRADRTLRFWGRVCADGEILRVCFHRQPQGWLQATV